MMVEVGDGVTGCEGPTAPAMALGCMFQLSRQSLSSLDVCYIPLEVGFL